MAHFLIFARTFAHFGWAMALYISLAGLWNLVMFSRDYTVFRSFYLNNSSAVDAQSFELKYNALITGTWRLNLLRRMRSRNILQPNEASEQAIRRLIDTLHREEEDRSRSPGLVSRLISSLTLWHLLFSRGKWRTFKIFTRSSERRDELYMLLENLTREQHVRSPGREVISPLPPAAAPVIRP